MDVKQNQNLFQELYTNIKQHADKSLTTLLERANEIELCLNGDSFFNNIIIDTSNIGQSNHQLNSKIKTVQNYLHEFLETVEHLTISLELDIQSYSDGNDFRTSIQSEILDELSSMKSDCISYLNQIIDYREQRALANKELFKRPQFDDNQYLISNLDCQLHRRLKLILIDLKSDILRIFNMLMKNKDIINAQSSHRQHMNSYL